MFEQLFRYPATIRRHQEGPLAEERIQYLAFKSEGGSPRSTLAQTAPYLLTIATRLNLANNTKVSMEEIETAANRWAHRRSRRSTQRSPRTFKLVALGWFRFLNRLALPQPRSEPYEELVSGFAAHLQNERGLAPRSITGLCWYVRKFLKQLVAQGSILREVSVKGIEDHFSWLANQGYTRRAFELMPKDCESFFVTRSGVDRALLGLQRPLRLPGCSNTTLGLRDHAILLFLYNSGARADEAAQVTIAELDLAHNLQNGLSSVRLIGKGRKVRPCPLWPKTASALAALVAGRPPSERVFLNRRGRPFTRFGIYALVKRHCNATRIQADLQGGHHITDGCT